MKRRTRVARASWWSTAALTVLVIGCARPALGQEPVQRPLAAQPSQTGQELSLEQAVAHAFARNPAVRAAEARLRQAMGRLTGAGTYPYNPILEGGAASRNGGGRRSVDFEVSLGQELEIAGQLGDRVDAARSELASERSSLLRAQRLIAARVHWAFVTALETRDLLAVDQRDMELAERLHDVAERRLARGAATQLDVNVAAAEFGRAEARFRAAEATHQGARAALAEAMGLGDAALPLPAGDLQANLDALPPLSEVARSAREHRADLRALRQLEDASRARHSLARAEGWPNLTLRAFAAREEGTDTIIGGALSIPIPLFNRNQGRVEETRAGIDRARAEREAGEVSARRQVVTAHARYRAGVHTAERLRQLVLGTLEQNLALLQRAFDAGRASWPEVVVIRRTLVEAQRDMTHAEADARRAWIELQIAAGRMPVPRGASAPEEEP